MNIESCFSVFFASNIMSAYFNSKKINLKLEIHKMISKIKVSKTIVLPFS